MKGWGVRGQECHKIHLDILRIIFYSVHSFLSNIVVWPVYTIRTIATINDNDHRCCLLLYYQTEVCICVQQVYKFVCVPLYNRYAMLIDRPNELEYPHYIHNTHISTYPSKQEDSGRGESPAPCHRFSTSKRKHLYMKRILITFSFSIFCVCVFFFLFGSMLSARFLQKNEASDMLWYFIYMARNEGK